MNKIERATKLISIQNEVLAAFYADSIRRGSEQYPNYYQKNARALKTLLKSELKTNIAMRKYFRELSERAIADLNWAEFERRKASVLDYLVQAFWENETLVLKVFLTKALVDALEGGGLFSEEELKVDVGWSRESAPAIEFLNKYTLSAAKSLTETTKGKVLAVLKTSINNGETVDEAAARINKTINDKVRATTISQTETVRAFSAGRMEVGRQVGADRKQWRTAADNRVSSYCLANERLGVVPFNYKYDDFVGEKITEPPAHPNCRSGIQLFMPGEKV